MRKELIKYFEMIDSFLKGEISAKQFEAQYLNDFAKDQTMWSDIDEKLYNILNGLFGDLDAFCDDPKLRDENDIDEETLRENCKLYYEQLKSY